MKFFYFLFASVITLTSCSVKHDIQIQKNGSGKMAFTLDMSAMSGMMGETTGEKVPTILEDTVMQRKLKKLETMDGIKSVKISEKSPGIYGLSYQFDSFDALNNSCSLMYSETENAILFSYFTRKDKKTIVFTIPRNPVEDDSPDALTMLEGFTFEMNLTFAQKIKKLESENGAVLGKDRKSVTYTTDLAKVSSPTFKPEMRIHF